MSENRFAIAQEERLRLCRLVCSHDTRTAKAAVADLATLYECHGYMHVAGVLRVATLPQARRHAEAVVHTAPTW